jgi:hypothetical protein
MFPGILKRAQQFEYYSTFVTVFDIIEMSA